MQYLGAISKNNRMISFPRQTIQHHSNQSLCPKQWCQRSWSWTDLWRPTRPSRTNTKKEKDVLFIIGDLNAKARSQETLEITGKSDLGVQNEAGQRLIEFCQETALVIANTLFQQHKRRLYVFAMTSAFSWQNSVSLWSVSFCTPGPNLPVTPAIF